jgi:hypothetical protein
MGDVVAKIAQDATAGTSMVRDALTKPKKPEGIRSVILTWMNGWGTKFDGGTVASPGPSEENGSMPAMVLGKVISTLLDSLFATSPVPLYPFNAAYWQGPEPEPVEQLGLDEALGSLEQLGVGAALEQLNAVPVVKPPTGVVGLLFTL